MSAVGLRGRGDPGVVARGTGAVHSAEDGDERGSCGGISLDELDLNGSRVGGDGVSSGAGGAPGEGVVPASLEDSAGIIGGRDGVGKVDVVRDGSLDSGSKGQSSGDDGLGEHYGYVCVKGEEELVGGGGGVEEMEKNEEKRKEKKRRKRVRG